MVLNMASQDGQSFFQPLSSWMSRMREAVQQAGDSLPFGNLSKTEGEPSVDMDSNLDLPYADDIYKTQLEDSNEDIDSYFENSADNQDESQEDSCSSEPTHGMDSVDSACDPGTHGQQPGRQQQNPGNLESRPEMTGSGAYSRPGTVTYEAYDDNQLFEMLPTIPEEEELIDHQIRDLLRDNGSDTAESVFNINDLDGISQVSYQDNISYREDDRISFDSRSPAEGRNVGRRKALDIEASPVYSLSRQATEGSLEMETAFSNQGEDGNEATDSSSPWSHEEHNDADATQQNTHEPISKCGDLDVIFDYRAPTQKLYVTVVEAKGIPDKDRSGVNAWQVHAVLLPSKKQKGKTGIQRGPEPVFQEKLAFNKLEPAELGSYALRFRLYAVRKMNRERMMGEKLVYLDKINPELETQMTLTLEPRINMSSGGSHLSLSGISHSDSASSSHSLSHGGVPELLVGLQYNATTGRLSVEIIKGSHFRNLAINRPPDTYGKLSLLNANGQEMSRCKTSVRRGQPNPVYKETFIFQVALFQLSDVTLMISIYNRRSMKRKEMIGWLSLGLNSSGEEEQSHWQEMKDSKGPQICRWHTLLES